MCIKSLSLLLGNVPSYVYHYLFIHSSTGGFGLFLVFSFNKAPSTFTYKSLRFMLSFLFGKYLRVEWLGHMVDECLTF